MLGLWLLSLPIFAFKAEPSTFLGTEPQRIRRFHTERQRDWRRSGAWTDFVGGIGHGWLARFDERTGAPLAAWGPPIDLGQFEDLDQVEGAVRRVFSDAPGVLGVPLDQLRLGRSGRVPSSDTWLVHLDQVLPGTDIPVYRSGVSLRISAGVLVGFGVDITPNLAKLGSQPSLDARAAEQMAIVSGPAGNSAHTDVSSSLMVLPIDANPLIHNTLVWRVKSKTEHPKGHWVSFVDAHTGALLNVHNEVRFLSGSVSAEHDVRTVDGERMVSPLPGMRIQLEEAATYTDEEGHWSVEGEGSASGDLLGPYIRIHNEQGSDAQFEDMSGEVLLTDADASQAELSAYVFQAQIRDWALEYAPDISLISSRLDVHVNINEHCNAYFDGNLNFMRAGSGCNNTGRIADVNYHEWGHGFHYYSLLTGSFDGPISEGIADAVSVLNTGDATISPGFYSSGHGIREVETNRVYPEDWVGEVHTDGLIFAGAVWDLRSRLAETMGEDEATHRTSQLLAAAIKSGPTIPEAFDAFIFADDDNADLSDGTPHSCEIIEAFSQHGLGPGGNGGSVVVLEHEGLEAQLPEVEIGVSISAINLAPECVDISLDAATVHFSVDGGETWSEEALSGEMDALFGVIPAQEAGTMVSYYFTVQTDGSGMASTPSGGAINPFTFMVGHLQSLYCEDFEDSDGGYTHALMAGANEEGADDWMWGTPLGLGGDPDFAFSGNKVWGNDLGGDPYDGQYQNDKYNRLTSVDIDVGEHEELVLQYRRWLSVEDGYYDNANILANGQEVWTNHGTDRNLGQEHHQDDQWMLHAIPVAADGSGWLSVDWEIVSDRGLTMGGWTIDDVCVYALTVTGGPGDDPDDDSETDSVAEDDYEVPASSGVIEGKRVGCSCAASPSRQGKGWLLLLIPGLISASRRSGAKVGR
jgi:hypothetical protein